LAKIFFIIFFKEELQCIINRDCSNQPITLSERLVVYLPSKLTKKGNNCFPCK